MTQTLAQAVVTPDEGDEMSSLDPKQSGIALDAETVMEREVERFGYAVQYRIPSLNMPRYDNRFALLARQGIAGIGSNGAGDLRRKPTSIFGHLFHPSLHPSA